MKMDAPSALLAQAEQTTPTEVFQQIGLITRQLHDTLQQLGVMPKLQEAAEGLPDARSRLSYIAQKSGAAAEKVLNSVDLAKAECHGIATATRGMVAALGTGASPSGAALRAFVATIDTASECMDGHLTDIMLAQDFHDLNGQVVMKVVALAADLEDSLVKLLVQTAPPQQTQKLDTPIINGHGVKPQWRSDMVSSQGEVDDLLASLGF